MNEEQIEALETMINNRIEATGETREQACDHISKVFEGRLKQLKEMND